MEKSAWDDLVEGLMLLRQANPDTATPFNCSHDTLAVMADPDSFTEEQIARLETLGFHADRNSKSFYSFRFGSA